MNSLFNLNYPIIIFFNSQKELIISEIKKKNDILTVKEEEYIEHLYSMFFIQKIKLNFEQETCDPFEKTIISGKDEFGDYYQKERELLKFEIPIYGRYELLNYSPSSRIMFSNFKNKKIRLCNENLLIEIPSIYNDNFKNAIDEYKQIKNLINKNVENINNDIWNFNNSLKPYITTIFKNEKDNLLKKFEILSKFEIPIKNN